MRCSVEIPVGDTDKGTWQTFCRIFPEDVNRKQTFDLIPASSDVIQKGVDSLRLVFEESSDFFGRITVYDLQIEGIVL